MYPTQLTKYRPHVKQSQFNHYLVSQLDFLPGNRTCCAAQLKVRKGGKKIFSKKYEETMEKLSRNQNSNLPAENHTINNNKKKRPKIYEIDEPIISYKDLNKH